jgi:hypothetical protein
VTEYGHLLGNASVNTFPLQRIATNVPLLGSKSLNTDFRDNEQNNRGTVRHELILRLPGSDKRVVIHS